MFSVQRLKRGLIFRKYLSVRDQKYLDWSIDKIVNWNQEEPIKNVVHIHGTNDLIFPIINLKNYIPIEKGDHAIILKRADWLNEYFSKNLA